MKTIEMKNAAISAAIAKRLAEGCEIQEAVDAVLGAGSFERIAGEVYDALNENKS